jgi:rubrerythrin
MSLFKSTPCFQKNQKKYKRKELGNTMAMLSLECGRCNYKFSSKTIPRKCPYCDREGSVKRAQMAQDIIDEALSEAEFYQERK